MYLCYELRVPEIECMIVYAVTALLALAVSSKIMSKFVLVFYLNASQVSCDLHCCYSRIGIMRIDYTDIYCDIDSSNPQLFLSSTYC